MGQWQWMSPQEPHQSSPHQKSLQNPPEQNIFCYASISPSDADFKRLKQHSLLITWFTSYSPWLIQISKGTPIKIQPKPTTEWTDKKREGWRHSSRKNQQTTVVGNRLQDHIENQWRHTCKFPLLWRPKGAKRYTIPQDLQRGPLFMDGYIWPKPTHPEPPPPLQKQKEVKSSQLPGKDFWRDLFQTYGRGMHREFFTFSKDFCSCFHYQIYQDLFFSIIMF